MIILEQLAEKGADVEAIASRAIRSPRHVMALVETLHNGKGTIRYACEKVLRLVSERRPGLVYPHFDVFVDLLDCDNSFIKWGAILTIAHLTAVDTEGKFEAIFKKYYAPIQGPTMVTAANIIGSSAIIARAKPHLIGRITREILNVERAVYERHGEISDECRNVAIGHAIDAFDELFDKLADKPAVLRFVKRQRTNTRAKVVQKAQQFIEKNGC